MLWNAAARGSMVVTTSISGAPLAAYSPSKAVLSFLISPDAGYVSGTDLLVDGALSIVLMGSLNMAGWNSGRSGLVTVRNRPGAEPFC